ncbi:U-box domain-containing protein 27-like [Prosopis cineraria]|uniref:U-box domain-containing protein 27-like n=1 Tax=Prosopis cineraria TaxID=364024 RepID=UPI00240EE59A|nr:U-box domain-containing protein 27-like [Prosopis cineraria]
MVRDDLYITIPTFFRCPISLDIMKSPVSLCTGVTYDRSSIQRWLDNGNNTCPATMQVLQTKEFVPNRTLQRLIQIWSDSVHNRVESAESPATRTVPSPDQVVETVKYLDGHGENCLDSLTRIVYFAEESEENREFLAKLDGFVPLLVDLLDNVNGDVEMLERVISALDTVLNKIEDREQLKRLMLKNRGNCLASLLLVLQQGSAVSKIGSVRILKFIAVDAESKVTIAEKEGLMSELLKSVAPDKDPALIENSLSCLVAISTPKRNKLKSIHLGAIKTLSQLLSGSNSSTSVTEKALKLLETMSSTKEGRSEICEDPACLPAVLQKVLKVSSIATEHAVMILWTVCYLFRDQKAQEVVAMANGFTKFLLLIQTNCSPAVRQMSADLLKIFRVNSKSCLSCYDTKTTHIMPF